LLLGALLVATAVAVRWLGASAEWTLLPPNATPVAAIGLFAGFLFANRTAALLVPLAALAISNLALDSYGSVWMVGVVYGSFLAAPLLGRWLRERPTAYRAVAAVLLPALLFYVTTNFATWLVGFGGPHAAYAASWHGLALCYARGIPFFRWMLEGDIAFSAILFGGYALVAALAGNRSPRFKHRRLAPCR
jgi:hypothetical protein